MKTIKSNHPLRSFTSFIVLLMMLIQMGCNRESEKSGEQLIAGENSKTWRATREVDAAGNSERTSREERKDVMQFYQDGRFTINTANEAGNGTWEYNASNQTLSLQFADQNVTENFQVLKLEEDEMRLRAGNNREMTLKAD